MFLVWFFFFNFFSCNESLLLDGHQRGSTPYERSSLAHTSSSIKTSSPELAKMPQTDWVQGHLPSASKFKRSADGPSALGDPQSHASASPWNLPPSPPCQGAANVGAAQPGWGRVKPCGWVAEQGAASEVQQRPRTRQGPGALGWAEMGPWAGLGGGVGWGWAGSLRPIGVLRAAMAHLTILGVSNAWILARPIVKNSLKSVF